MNQLTNLQSLGFFPEIVSCDIDFCGFFDVALDPSIFSIIRFVVDLVEKVVVFVSVPEADDSPAPSLRSSLFHLSSLHLLYWGTIFLSLI